METTAEQCFYSDVLIVGAGPAGSTAAYYLAKSGHNVVVLDRESFPRDKICGDFVGPLAIKELQDIGITKLAEFKQTNIINAATVYLDGQELVSSSMPAFPGLEQHGRVIPRKKLDNWLLDAARKAGATVIENVLVTDFHVEKDRVKVVAHSSKGSRVFQTSLLIGADGSNSLIATKLRGYTSPKANRIIGVRGYFDNVSGLSSQANMHFSSESFPGYCWLFPTGENQANVGVGVLLETTPKCDQPKDLLAQVINQDEGLKRRLKNATLKDNIQAWPLNTYDPHLPNIGNRVMLIGEAAGLVNPLNGEGIQYALLSGRWASEVADSCIKTKDFSEKTLSVYSKRIENEFGYGFRLSAFIIQLIRNRNLNPLWLQTLEIMTARAKDDPAYAAIAGGILAGLLSPNQGLDPKFILSVLEEATISSGLRIIDNAISDPTTLPQTALKITQAGFEVAANTIQNPVDFLQWGMETAAKVAELVVTFPNNLLRIAENTPENT